LSTPHAARACLGAAVLVGAACLAAQGPLPGDVAATRALQSVLGESPAWAQWVTPSAKAPGVWATLCVAVALAYARGGAPAAAAPPVALLAAHGLDTLLRALVFAPKPDPELVAVAVRSAASGLPSTFGLVYGGLFGAVLLAPAARDAPATAAAALAAALLAVGACARLVLGGHWASQMLASLLLAFALVLPLRAAVRALRRRRTPA